MFRNYLLGAFILVSIFIAPCQAAIFQQPQGGVVQPPSGQTVTPPVPTPQSQGVHTPQPGIQPGPAQPGQDQPGGSIGPPNGSYYDTNQSPQLQR